MVDVNCLFDTSDVYDKSWGVNYKHFIKKIHEQGLRMVHLEIADSFTLAITDDSKIYSWGLNDESQLGRLDSSPQPSVSLPPGEIRVFKKTQPRQITVGSDHTLMLDYNNNLYAWGCNNAGQLGLGHSTPTPQIIKLTKFNTTVKAVEARDSKSFILQNDGNISFWPSQPGSFDPKPIQCSDPFKKFTEISVGTGFLIALSSAGIVYSRGDNAYGQLGLGGFGRHFDQLMQVET
jgi:alpha-tubulin suppressor-like RCC1 family protein